MRPAILPLALAPLALLACGPHTRTADLYYPPRDEADVRPIPAAFVPEDAPTIVVQDFEDRRRWLEIGDRRTAQRGRHTTRVLSEVPVEEWVRDGVTAELERAGLETVPEALALPEMLYLSGRVHAAFVSRRFYYEGTVRITGIVRCGCHGKILLSRKFVGETSLPTDVVTDDPYSETLSRALRRVGQLLAADVAALSPCR